MAVLNLNKFNSLLKMAQKNKATLLQMLHNMLNASEDNIEQLQFFARQQQREELLQALHKIRGGYATLGAEQLAASCRQLEHDLEQNSAFNEQSLQDIITLYRHSCQDIRSALQADAEAGSTANQPVDLHQLHKLLLQHNMQASDMVAASRAALTIQHPASSTGNLSISLGIAIADIAHTYSADVVERADKQLYITKQNGRNNYSIA